MPNAPKAYKPGCSSDYKPPERRPPRQERGYDAKWERLRNWYMSKHPICEHPRCNQAAREVDHIEPIEHAPHRRLDIDNLQALCIPHHRQKTARDKRLYAG